MKVSSRYASQAKKVPSPNGFSHDFHITRNNKTYPSIQRINSTCITHLKSRSEQVITG